MEENSRLASFLARNADIGEKHEVIDASPAALRRRLYIVEAAWCPFEDGNIACHAFSLEIKA